MALVYQKTGTETRYKDVTRTVEQDIGFEDIAICRPSFLFFDFTGLMPNSPHWFFLDGVDITKYINTSFTLDSLNTAPRNSLLRDPGDAYISETQFPAAHGGPTNSGSGSVNTDAAGNLSGAFYLQSNATTSFKVGTKALEVIDTPSNNKITALSFSQVEFEALGIYDLYFEDKITTSEAYQEDIYDYVFVPDPPPIVTVTVDNDNDDPIKWVSVYNAADDYNYYAPEDLAKAILKNEGSTEGYNPDAKNGTNNFKWPWQS